jgi:AraC family transcriptional regulator
MLINSIVPSDMKVITVTPHKYGVFTYMGEHHPEEISSKNLAKIWSHVFQTWMPTINFDLTDKFSFEYINYAKCSKHYCECDLYYPISVVSPLSSSMPS